MIKATPMKDIGFNCNISLQEGIRDEKMIQVGNNMGGAHSFIIPSVFEARGFMVE